MRLIKGSWIEHDVGSMLIDMDSWLSVVCDGVNSTRDDEWDHSIGRCCR